MWIVCNLVVFSPLSSVWLFYKICFHSLGRRGDGTAPDPLSTWGLSVGGMIPPKGNSGCFQERGAGCWGQGAGQASTAALLLLPIKLLKDQVRVFYTAQCPEQNKPRNSKHMDASLTLPACPALALWGLLAQASPPHTW